MLRQSNYFKLGSLYKARFPRAGQYVVDKLKKGDDESLMTLGFMWIPDDATASEKDFIKSTGETLLTADTDELREKASAFVSGFQSR